MNNTQFKTIIQNFYNQPDVDQGQPSKIRVNVMNTESLLSLKFVLAQDQKKDDHNLHHLTF